MSKSLTHVAIIMDGNRRWAKAHGKSTLEGHEQGAETLREILEESVAQGIRYLTVYGFSSENWNRQESEVSALMSLMQRLLETEIQTLHEKGVRLRVIGDRSLLPQNTAYLIAEGERLTLDNDRIHLTIALSYGARQEIVNATKAISKRVLDGEVALDDIDEELFAGQLYTSDIPDPDLFIRPGGELRVSNFLLWQISYSELYFVDQYWPDFSREDYRKALEAFGTRQRRFGD